MIQQINGRLFVWNPAIILSDLIAKPRMQTHRIGSRLDRGQRVYDHSSVPYRRPCLGHTSLIIQEISSAALSPHHERFCPTRDLCYIPTPDAFHYVSGVGPPVTLHCGKLWDTRRRHLKLGLVVGLPLDAHTHT